MQKAELINKESEQNPTVVLIGNPNVGKSVIFNYLTGKYVNVANYPGTTIEITRGIGKLNKLPVNFLDTPGTNSLIPNSEDERVTRDIILNEPVSSILQIGDGKNLKRVLLLSLELAEMKIPFILNLNMMDELKQRGMRLDIKRLSEILGIKVNSSIAIRRVGLDNLVNLLELSELSIYQVTYPILIEKAITEIEQLLSDTVHNKRAMALMLMAQDGSMQNWVEKNLSSGQITSLQRLILELEGKLKISVSYAITQTRFKHVDRIYNQVMTREDKPVDSFFTTLDHYITHPLWGIPFLLAGLFLVYQFVGVFGAGWLVDLFENTLFGKFINPAAEWLFINFVPVPFIQDLFVGTYGIITMALAYGFAIVLPIVTTFFLVFSIMEDSGYLPRLALLVNRLFGLLGLNGKAVLPMVLGLGCDTMATMAARIMESRKERIIVILLLALGVPCSAQLGVILGMTAMLPWQGIVLWFIILTGIMMLVGALSAKILPGEKSDFILELPPLRAPVLNNIIIKTVARIEWYLKEIIPIFILGTLILFSFDQLQIMQYIESLAAPIVQNWLGLPAKATESFLIGFLRRDYGAAGLFNLANQGALNGNQIVVSIITITLFMPCIANFLMIIKELGLKIALKMALFIVPFALIVGGLVNYFLFLFGVAL